jgi:uncharacterized protein YbaP (TraB family)
MNHLCAPMFAVLFALTGLTGVSAKSPSTVANKSLLWKISGKDLNKPSYLFGTMHIICPDDYIWTKKMEEALTKSEKVCFEMDMDAPAVMMSVATGLIDPSGMTLLDHFGAENYKKVSDYMRDSLGINIMLFNTMRPTILPVLFSEKSSHCQVTVSYEDKIMQAAKSAGKEIQGLEYPEDQIALLNTLPADSVIKDIMDIVNGTKNEDTNYYKMIAAYKSQDITALHDLINASQDMGDNPGVFIDDRNIKWIPRMVDMMDQNSMFFAVGAGHLWGDNGVINLLRKEGYTVTPIK